jgi:[acyl-carrier-protein] S-malonyltransferase
MGVTLLFPGQGAQYVGMGKNLLDFPESKNVFDKADEALGFKISNLCFEGPVEDLTLTENTQPAIVTHSIALFEKLKTILDEKNISINRVLGHSVGEYSALVAAGSISLEDAVLAVKSRGSFMQDATPAGVGKMFAIMRVPSEIVTKACEASSNEENKVMAANFNEPTQTVISGHAEACQRAVTWISENFEGRSRAIELKVSAPFHSSLMKPAEHKLNTFFDSISIKENEIPYVANINTEEYAIGTNGNIIRENLVNQVCGSVLWSQSISKLSDKEIFIEVGPGKVLAGLNKKINKEFRTYSLDSESGFEGLVEFLNECTK